MSNILNYSPHTDTNIASEYSLWNVWKPFYQTVYLWIDDYCFMNLTISLFLSGMLASQPFKAYRLTFRALIYYMSQCLWHYRHWQIITLTLHTPGCRLLCYVTWVSYPPLKNSWIWAVLCSNCTMKSPRGGGTKDITICQYLL